MQGIINLKFIKLLLCVGRVYDSHPDQTVSHYAKGSKRQKEAAIA
jgi:hypothetical protein